MLKPLIHGFHRYGGLVVCVQIMLWSLSGFLMAFWSFGDLYVDPPPAALALADFKLLPPQLEQKIQAQLAVKPDAEKVSIQKVEWVTVAQQPYYRVHLSNQNVLLLDQAGEAQSPLSPALAARIAREQYTGQGELGTVDLLPTSRGNYFSSTPVFKATFQDAQHTEIYIDPQSGTLLARRKALWSWYNRMWEFHLMKYSADASTNKILLLVFATLSFLVSLTGLFKFFR